MSCPFCAPPEHIVHADDRVVAIRDRYPVSPGHTLIVPRAHVETWFDATPEDQRALLRAVDIVKRILDAGPRPPHGYNVGFNAGAAAGQTVMHLHVHVIPRWEGDMPDPRGGVRHVIPDRANYLIHRVPPLAVGGPDDPFAHYVFSGAATPVDAPPTNHPLATGGEADPFARHVLPLLARATRVDIVAAFVKDSGLLCIQDAFLEALDRGVGARLVTGDYLNITDISALERLLEWTGQGGFQVGVVQSAKLPGNSRSFHPKAWCLEGADFGVAFVGSSNLSRSALGSGIEWNLRVDREHDHRAWESVDRAFTALWATTTPLTREWIAEYAARPRPIVPPAPEPPAVATTPTTIQRSLTPHEVQLEALAALRTAREQGRRRALVVLATGLGKTWLAAFDYCQLWDDLGRQPRLLFLVHRREILEQAARTFAAAVQARGEMARIGFCVDERANLDADLVFASIPKLWRPQWLVRLEEQSFDYVVVDEVHHAAAKKYGEVLSCLTSASFMLGLTATPDRADAADILGLFDDRVAYRADIIRGVEIKRLVPFRYFGIPDEINYKNIPWRNRSFVTTELATAAQSEDRMQTLWRAWQDHPGTRTLVFCCNIAHANYAADWLATQRVRVARVYSGTGSDDRDLALQQLENGEIDAVCAIDIFNEGVDIPTLDRVVMLRPTESGVVFLQQLGRGLRMASAKRDVTVLDFVGNHRIFLERIRRLLSIGERTIPVGALLAAGRVELPAGCSVEISLEAKHRLMEIFRGDQADSVEQAYHQFREAHGRRPTALELHELGHHVSALRKRNGSWFGFVAAQNDLDQQQRTALTSGFLAELETTTMEKSYKMVTLAALLDEGSLFTGMPLRDLALAAWRRLQGNPELLADVPAKFRPTDMDDPSAIQSWVGYWMKDPIHAWTRTDKKREKTWFKLDGDRFRLGLPADPALPGLVHELVEYRLADYSDTAILESFTCKVFHNESDPILQLPDRTKVHIPWGNVPVRLPDGSRWVFKFVKIACNKAWSLGAPGNGLPDLLRTWFGPTAGDSKTAFHVRFSTDADGNFVEPVATVENNVIDIRAKRRPVVAYPDLRAAAGAVSDDAAPPDRDTVLLPVKDDAADRFTVRVSGNSMNGGSRPLRDGDWAVFRWCRKLPASAVQDRIALVQYPGGGAWQIKRIIKDGRKWRLASDNPASDGYEAIEGMTVLARLEGSFRPEELAPEVGAQFDDPALAFGVEVTHTGRWGGHLFIVIDGPGQLVAPNRVRATVQPRPAETAFVLIKEGDGWRYLGVGRWQDGTWRIPTVDTATWTRWGAGS